MPVTPLAPDVLTARRWASGTSLALFIFGFSALNIFSAIGIGQKSLPGLYTFRAATVGDGLLLPTLAYSLVRSAGLHRGWLTLIKWPVIVAAGLACAGGAAVQASWLLNPHPRLNWTLPAPHEFNLPGWYHAVFLVVACGFFAGVATASFLRVHGEAQSDAAAAAMRIRSVGVLCVLIPGPAFIALLMTDNASVGQRLPLSSIAAAAGSELLLILGLCCATGWSNLRWNAIAGFASMIPAVGLSALFPQGLVNNSISILPAISAALAGAFSSSALHARSGIDRLILAATLAVCAAGPVYAMSSERTVTLLSLACGYAAGIILIMVELVLLRSLLADTSIPPSTASLMPLALMPILALGLAGRYFAQERQNAASYGNIVGGVSAALILAVAPRAIRFQFSPVIEAERADAPAERPSALKWRAYLAISTAYIAALLAFLTFIMGTTSLDNWVNGLSGSDRKLSLLGVVLLVLIAPLWAIGSTGRRTWLAPHIRVVLATSICLAWAGTMATALTAGYGDWKQAALSLVVALISGLFALEGVTSNTAYLHNLPVDWHVLAVGGSSALAVAASTAWMAGPALASTGALHTVSYSLISLVIATAACLLLPFAAARTLPGSSPPQQYAMAKPLAGVLQDCFLVTLLAISAAWAPNFFLAHVKSAGTWWGIVLSYLALLSAAYVYVMRNNVGHVEREGQRRTAQAAALGAPLAADQQQAQEALARHIRRQNCLAIIALFPLGMVLITTEITGFDEKGLSQLLEPHRL